MVLPTITRVILKQEQVDLDVVLRGVYFVVRKGNGISTVSGVYPVCTSCNYKGGLAPGHAQLGNILDLP